MAKRDVNKPKGNMSAYAYFVHDCREELKQVCPGTPVIFLEFTKTCSARWKTLSESEKKKYEQMAKKDKARYDQEMRDYVPPKGVKRKKRWRRDPRAPKRPMSAFLVFCVEYRPTVRDEYPDVSIGELSKKLSEMWSKISVEHRKSYERIAEQMRRNYVEDVAEYRAKFGIEAQPVKKRQGRPPRSTKTVKAEEHYDHEQEEEEEEEYDDCRHGCYDDSNDNYQVEEVVVMVPKTEEDEYGISASLE